MMKAICRDGGRINDFSGMYCKMAMNSFYCASKFYEEIKNSDFAYEKFDDEEELKKWSVSTIVFSALSLEAFFNNYIASVFGDEKYNNVYDSLPPQSKFQLIADFIFKVKIDKSKSYYGGLVALFRARNNYVHCKSESAKKHMSYDVISMDENEAAERLEYIPSEPPKLDKGAIDSDIKGALNALKAVRDVARFFDENDSNCYAMVHLFSECNFEQCSRYEQEFMEFVFHKLGIKKRGSI